MKRQRTAIFGGRIRLSVCAILMMLVAGCSTVRLPESQSAAWQVVITDVSRVAKNNGFKPKSDIIMITMDLVCRSGGSVEAPAVSLSDEKNQDLRLLDITRIIRNEAGEKETPIPNESFEILNWFQQKSSEKIRHLNAGDKFTLTYIFENPGGAGRLQLKVADTPPLILY